MQIKVCLCACACVCVSVSPLITVCVRACMHVSGASMSALERQNALSVHLRVCAEESFSKSRLAALVFTMSLQLQRPFNLKTSQFESPSNIWPVFLLWLNDWMHPRRFLLTSSPIWNLVPVRSAQNAHTHTHTHTHTRTHTRANTARTHAQTHI